MIKSLKTQRCVLMGTMLFYFPYVYAQSTAESMELGYENLKASKGNAQSPFLNIIKNVGEPSIPFLLEKLPSSDSTVKATILTALQLTKASCAQAEKPVWNELADTFWLTRYNAAVYLAVMECRSAREVLMNKLSSESHPMVLISFFDTLGLLGDTRDRNHLETFQNDTSKEPKLRLAAATALARLGAPYDEEFCLTQLSKPDSSLQSRALEAISYSRNPKILEIIRQYEGHPDPIGSYALISKERFNMNKSNITETQKTDRFWELLKSDQGNVLVLQWAIKELLKRPNKNQTISKLKKEFLKEESNHTSHSSIQGSQMDMKSNLMIAILIQEGILKKNELDQNELKRLVPAHVH